MWSNEILLYVIIIYMLLTYLIEWRSEVGNKSLRMAGFFYETMARISISIAHLELKLV